MRKHRLRRVVALLLLIAGIGTQTGCWDNKDINHRSLPVVMGISKTEDLYTVVLQIPEPSQNSNMGTDFRFVQSTGSTINEIVDRIGANMETQMDLLHLKVILIEQGYAEEGINDAVSAFMRTNVISPRTMAVICDEPIEHFFSKIKRYSQNNGTILEDFFQFNAGWSPQVAQSRMWELFRSIHSYTHDEAIPIIKSGSGTVIETRGSGIIRNGKMVGRLSANETLLANIFNGLDVKGKIEVMNSATVQIVGNRIRNKSSMEDGIPVLRSSIHLKVTLLEMKGNPTKEQIKEQLQANLEERLNSVLRKMKADQADILGLGQLFRNKLTRDQLQAWRTDYLPHLKTDITFEVSIESEGDLKMGA
ncbi:Ger(x)C family spore germination protein [Paenibacillus sp. 1011MAR3C5]|uniref:Ger(x)C family spore germination protein n=1 Tax=Paenibacillus sp. 1011MAR3C5 TaxID=1675787 RepID=UPI000E6C8E11|nr:Ger(x)C family spore germination protein [Paenibacillus sp. 1011MAR3C5]RJE86956.1 Ger(x)C family spore germination protein [Paenibacillus sp. 1011MAR3C5]